MRECLVFNALYEYCHCIAVSQDLNIFASSPMSGSSKYGEKNVIGIVTYWLEIVASKMTFMHYMYINRHKPYINRHMPYIN